jgi:hypothetical protein
MFCMGPILCLDAANVATGLMFVSVFRSFAELETRTGWIAMLHQRKRLLFIQVSLKINSTEIT